LPSRYLKESICTSETLNLLSAEAERFFYRLLVQVDDFGRQEAHPKVLRAKCFPHKIDSLTDEDILKWLNELIAAGLLIVYSYNGKPYLQFITFKKHNTPRAKKSKYPGPTDGEIETCKHLHADENKGMQPKTDALVFEFDNVFEPEFEFGDQKTENPLPTPEEFPEASNEERQVLHELKRVPGYPFDYQKDLEHIRELKTDFPQVDMLKEVKKWRDHKKDNPLTGKKNPRLQLRNWCDIAVKRINNRASPQANESTKKGVNGPGSNQIDIGAAKPSKYPTLRVINGQEVP
jgi:hypothetical protein